MLFKKIDKMKYNTLIIILLLVLNFLVLPFLENWIVFILMLSRNYTTNSPIFFVVHKVAFSINWMLYITILYCIIREFSTEIRWGKHFFLRFGIFCLLVLLGSFSYVFDANSLITYMAIHLTIPIILTIFFVLLLIEAVILFKKHKKTEFYINVVLLFLILQNVVEMLTRLFSQE